MNIAIISIGYTEGGYPDWSALIIHGGVTLKLGISANYAQHPLNEYINKYSRGYIRDEQLIYEIRKRFAGIEDFVICDDGGVEQITMN